MLFEEDGYTKTKKIVIFDFKQMIFLTISIGVIVLLLCVSLTQDYEQNITLARVCETVMLIKLYRNNL